MTRASYDLTTEIEGSSWLSNNSTQLGMFTNKPWALNGQKLDHHDRPVGGSYVFPDFMVLFFNKKDEENPWQNDGLIIWYNDVFSSGDSE